MRAKLTEALADRLQAVERVLDKVDRSVERIEIVTVVREPNTSLSADAYNGLRKQIIAAVGERNAHIHQLAQFDSALRAGSTPQELSTLVGHWLAQASVEILEDLGVEGAFDLVGPADATGRRIIRPAYIDTLTRRIVQPGVAERVAEPPRPAVKPETAVPASEPEAEDVAPIADEQLPTTEAVPSADDSLDTPGGEK